MSNNIIEAEKKLDYADYLLKSTFSDSMASGAIKHTLAAANLAVIELAKMDESLIASPRAVQQTLEKFEESEYRNFASTYMRIWQTSKNQEVSAHVAKDLVRKTKAFIDKVKMNRMLTI